MKSVVALLLTICMIIGNANVTFAAVASQNSFIDPRINWLEEAADHVETVENGKLYTIDQLNAVFLVSPQEDGSIKLVVDEGSLHNVAVIDANYNIYLNGKKVEIVYDQTDISTEVVPKNVSGWSVKDTPSYGQPSEYTTYKGSGSTRDIALNQALATIGAGILAGIIAKHFKLSGTDCIKTATSIISAFTSSYTTSLSCKTRITYHKDSAGGWKDGKYCEKHTTTWYEKKDYEGRTTVTANYHCRYLI